MDEDLSTPQILLRLVFVLGLIVLLGSGIYLAIQYYFFSNSEVIDANYDLGISQTTISKVIGTNVYLKNGFGSLKIINVRVDSINCDIKVKTYEEEIILLDLSICLDNSFNGEKELKILTDKGTIITSFIFSNEDLEDNLNNTSLNSTSQVFISIWDTTKVSDTSSFDNQIMLPLEQNGFYDLIVYWGDGNTSRITSWNQDSRVHTYNEKGVYEIRIDGIIEGFSFNNFGDRNKILDITQFGNLKLGNNGGYFSHCENLQITASDSPDLSQTTNFAQAFYFAKLFNSNISHWNVSTITTMHSTFSGALNFNSNISSWDVSSVEEMVEMFSGASHFNQSLQNWNVSSVKDMSGMFSFTDVFNQDISSWDVSSVQNMENMFLMSLDFNQNLSSWDVENVLNYDNYDVGTLNTWNETFKPKFN